MQAAEYPGILIACFAPLPGGGATSRTLWSLARMLRRQAQVDLIAPRRRGQRFTEANGIGRVYRVPLGGIDHGPEAEGRFRRAVQRQLRAQVYDAVVVGDPLSAIAVHEAGVSGTRLVYCLRELQSSRITDFGPQLNRALQAADQVVVPTARAASELATAGVDPAKVRVIDPYIELRGLFAEEPPIGEQRLALLAFERPARAVSLAAQLLDQLPPEWTMVVPSDGGEQRDELKVAAYGFHALRVELPRAWPTRRLARLLNRCTVAVVAGQSQAAEALGLVNGDRLLAEASQLPMVEADEDARPADLVEKAIGLASSPAQGAGLHQRPADLIAAWFACLGVGPERMIATPSQEPTSADTVPGSGSVTGTDWAETDMSRTEDSSSNHDNSVVGESRGED